MQTTNKWRIAWEPEAAFGSHGTAFVSNVATNKYIEAPVTGSALIDPTVVSLRVNGTGLEMPTVVGDYSVFFSTTSHMI